ncbi:helix-turn-helix domain-containing protein (plasmid) [Pseudonocardia sp. DSM 110487]|nr:helix-turn-helix domain-containing protein [Pseudonocardia sp. DSM 110487]
MPPPDDRVGHVWVWKPSRIVEWAARRSGSRRAQQGDDVPELGAARADPDAEWWTVDDVALYLGVKPRTVVAYRSVGSLPEPDRRVGRRVLWRPRHIIEWRAGRSGDEPRQGVGDDQV